MGKRRAQKVELPAGVGKVTLVDGAPHYDEFGFAARVGLLNPAPADAARIYPLFELAPGEQRPTPGELVEGLPVFAWVAAEHVARLAGVAARTVREWTTRGIPHQAHAGGRRYPQPHAAIWYVEYQSKLQEGPCEHLPFTVALARHRLRQAEEDTAHGSTQPTTRRRQ